MYLWVVIKENSMYAVVFAYLGREKGMNLCDSNRPTFPKNI